MISYKKLTTGQLMLRRLSSVAAYRSHTGDLSPVDAIAYWMEDHGFTLSVEGPDAFCLCDDFADELSEWNVSTEQAVALEERGVVVLERKT